MGLDAVEIVMEVEDAFGIVIEDAEAEKILTPRDLIDVIMSKVERANVGVSLTHRAFNRLRAALLRQLPLKRRDIGPQAGMANLVPRASRKILAECLAAELETPPLPNLIRPKWLVNLLIVGAFGLGIAAALLVLRGGLLQHKGGALVFIALFTGSAAAALGFFATRPFRLEFPPSIATVGDLTRWIVAYKPDLAPVSSTPGKWTREQVAARIRTIIIEQLGCATTYREDASFVQDLGMG